MTHEFVALLVGYGEGCDHTIDCNKTWKFLVSTELEDAEQEIKDLFEGYGGEENIEKITLVRIHESLGCMRDYTPDQLKTTPSPERGCGHEETDHKFCGECGKPTWLG